MRAHSFEEAFFNAIGGMIALAILAFLGWLLNRYNNHRKQLKAQGKKGVDWLKWVFWSSLIWVPLLIILYAAWAGAKIV